MEFTEMEKRMLYQTEGTERYAVLREVSMASQYGMPENDLRCVEMEWDGREWFELRESGMKC